jgi:NADH peroxidase
MKVIILGGSHGGQETVKEILENYTDVNIKWFEKSDMAIVAGWDQSQAKQIISDYSKKNVQIFSNTEIIAVDNQKHSIVAKDKQGRTFTESYDKLVISTGSKPNTLPVPGSNLKNILSLSGRADMDNLRRLSSDTSIKNVVVVGGGYIGIGATQILSMGQKNVTLIDVADLPLSTYLDEELTNLISKDLIQRGITIASKNTVKAFQGTNGKVSSVMTDKNNFPADLVVVAAGSHPNTDYLKDVVDMDERGFVETDKYQHTSDPDIFAIGDITKIHFNPGNIDMNISLASNVRLQASCVVRNLFDAKYPLLGVQGTSAWQSFDYQFASTGLNKKSAEKLNIPIKTVMVQMDLPISHTEQTNVIFKLIFDPITKEIMGAQILAKSNFKEYINAISLAIQTHATIEQLAYGDFFFEPGLHAERNILNVAGLKAVKLYQNEKIPSNQ